MTCDTPVSSPALNDLMRRFGIDTDPQKFLNTVALAYQAEQSPSYRSVVPKRFRESASFRDFTAAVDFAAKVFPNPSILAVGCGAGLVGLSGQFAAKVIVERDLQPCKLTSTDLTAVELNPRHDGGPYDVVVTHSLLHFIADLKTVFEFFRARLKPRAAFVVSHEPNARFWNHPTRNQLVEQHRRALRRRKDWQNVTSLSWYVDSAIRVLSGKREPPLHERVNVRLKQAFPLGPGLTAEELAALVDPHLPASPSFSIGRKGLDCAEIREEFLPDFRIAFEASSESRGMPEAAAQAAGLPGSVFTTVFVRETA